MTLKSSAASKEYVLDQLWSFFINVLVVFIKSLMVFLNETALNKLEREINHNRNNRRIGFLYGVLQENWSQDLFSFD